MTAQALIDEQRALWSTRPREWAQLAEPQNHALFERLLDLTAAGPGTRLLDLGCGSGYAAALAVGRGARVSGVDIAPALLAIARERTPQGDFREAQIEALPFADGAFDVATAVNALQFAAEPPLAIAEAARALRGGGRFAAAAFAEPERNEGTVLHLAMKELSEQGQADGYAPYSLSEEGALTAALSAAGLAVEEEGELPVVWSYRDAGDALLALLASAGGARAVRAAGEPRVREVLDQQLAQFERPDGAIAIRNVFRYAVAVKR
ncbi:MAG TPA: methyltransferase domain-containing protein [Solirubrobacteraceae bacterium]|jgi:SAM-dependent methyltransferase|nr:methyltransferase domain-containing protein [Solirubrobacteraceae bacterium]